MLRISHLTSEIEAELTRQAEVRGMDVPAYAASLLEQAAVPFSGAMNEQSLKEFEESLDRLAQFSDEIPALPDAAFSRESIYRDHD